MKNFEEAVKQPKEGFIKLLETLAQTPVTKSLVNKMSELVVSAKIEKYILKPLDVEHEDYDRGKQGSSKALVFNLVRQEMEYKLIIGDPNINKKPPHDLFPFSEYGFIRFGWEHEPNLTLWGENNLSIWSNDDYLFETQASRDREFAHQLMDYESCLIENGNYQWVVKHKDTGQFAIVTGLLSNDFDEKNRENESVFQIDLIEKMELGEIYLRLMVAKIWNISARKSLQDDKIFNLN